ncbi:zinc finger, CCHC-type containing protein, partial [Tanacetum coccineum]
MFRCNKDQKQGTVCFGVTENQKQRDYFCFSVKSTEFGTELCKRPFEFRCTRKRENVKNNNSNKVRKFVVVLKSNRFEKGQRGRKKQRGNSNHKGNSTRNKGEWDLSKVRCYKCQKLGHLRKDCRVTSTTQEQSNLILEDDEPSLLMTTHEDVLLNEGQIQPGKYASGDASI